MLIVITGPIASGKSTVALELARALERTQVRVAVIDLDLVHDTITHHEATSGEAIWARARREAAAQANAFLDEGMTVVVVEGSFNTPQSRHELAHHLATGGSPLYVTLRVSFAEALRRAQGDPTRGRSARSGVPRSVFRDLRTDARYAARVRSRDRHGADSASRRRRDDRRVNSTRDRERRISMARPSLTRPRARSTLWRGHTRGAGGDDRAARP